MLCFALLSPAYWDLLHLKYFISTVLWIQHKSSLPVVPEDRWIISLRTLSLVAESSSLVLSKGTTQLWRRQRINQESGLDRAPWPTERHAGECGLSHSTRPVVCAAPCCLWVARGLSATLGYVMWSDALRGTLTRQLPETGRRWPLTHDRALAALTGLRHLNDLLSGWVDFE